MGFCRAWDFAGGAFLVRSLLAEGLEVSPVRARERSGSTREPRLHFSDRMMRQEKKRDELAPSIQPIRFRSVRPRRISERMRKQSPFDTDSVRQLAKSARRDRPHQDRDPERRLAGARGPQFHRTAATLSPWPPRGRRREPSSPQHRRRACEGGARKQSTVNSPMVGTAYRRPSRGPSLVEIGSAVKAGERCSSSRR